MTDDAPDVDPRRCVDPGVLPDAPTPGGVQVLTDRGAMAAWFETVHGQQLGEWTDGPSFVAHAPGGVPGSRDVYRGQFGADITTDDVMVTPAGCEIEVGDGRHAFVLHIWDGTMAGYSRGVYVSPRDRPGARIAVDFMEVPVDGD